MRNMQAHDRISAIEGRAEVLNLSLWRVCKLAGVDFSNISRWRRGECSPSIDRFQSVMSTLEEKLAELEEQMANNLRGRVKAIAFA